MHQKNFTLIFLFTLFLHSEGWSQTPDQGGAPLEIITAEELEFERVRGYQRLLRNVQMKHQNSLIYCDSAHFYEEQNLAKLFGNVRIVDQKDPVVTTSKYAEYDGNTKIAKLRNTVVFKNEGTTLYTDYLDYNRLTGVADYFNSGKVVDSTNVLTSQNGRYQTQLERITFTENVVLVNPDYTLKTNHLVYLTIPKTAETKDITNVISKDGDKLNARRGSFYDTENKLFRFFDGDVETENTFITGEILYYDETAMYYEGKENVSIFNKERNLEVFGDEGKHWEDRKYSLVYGNALVQKYFEMDTLFMISDTLISQDGEEESQKFLLAFEKVRMIKSEMAGRSDSLAYIFSDSTIHLYRDPVLWNDKSQITADSISFLIANEELDRALLRYKTFAITQDTINNFNQIKGRKMTAFFKDGDISKLDVEGNGESLYFALENDTTLKGLNKLICGRIMMYFEEGNIKKINHTINPEATFTPPQLFEMDKLRLEGFVWREEEKPEMEDIYAWRTPKPRKEEEFNFFNQPDVRLPLPDEDEIQKILNENQNKIPQKKLIENLNLE
ncbi:OstA-like protein [Pararhodonellum marinum]|uniref:OstA-like protein n=1 Tax=Pararhodonellum marinum TaxID=2755358 RepID=UPI00188E7DEF|nr:OstA-like protein [Pararhodonellum marinum]